MGLFLTTRRPRACGSSCWALWVKSFDAFLMALLMIIIAATLRSSRRTSRATARTQTGSDSDRMLRTPGYAEFAMCSWAAP